MSYDETNLLDRIETMAGEVCGAVHQLNHWIGRTMEPPERRAHRLTAEVPFADVQNAHVGLSLGIYNEGDVPIYLSVGGEPARAGSGAEYIPAGAMAVIPARVQDFRIAIDPADLASVPATGVWVKTYLYWTPQPAALFTPAVELTA